MQPTPRPVPTAQNTAPRCPATGGGTRPRCPRAAGFGTDHPGTGQCRQHELEAAAAARTARADRIPPTVFQEAVYVDGLPYEDTAPGMPADDEDNQVDGWDTAA